MAVVQTSSGYQITGPAAARTYGVAVTVQAAGHEMESMAKQLVGMEKLAITGKQVIIPWQQIVIIIPQEGDKF